MTTTGLSIWQMLPLGPTGYGDSPYQCFSAFAGNTLLIELPGEVPKPALNAHSVEWEQVIAHKRALLEAAIDRFVADERYHAFVKANADWLPDYALFAAVKQAFGGVEWTSWDADIAAREPDALLRWRGTHATEIERVQIAQYFFFAQFYNLKRAAAAKGIRLMGDLPIYVAHDSADVWANPSLFRLDATGLPVVQAGVPPDYFSATGQLWGNPIYDWEAMHADGYAWWIKRMKASFQLFDIVRIDHFRGFESYWEVPGEDTTAVNGAWVKGPGVALFDAIKGELGDLPIVAEDLGLITPDVAALRDGCGFPGMAILQFAFGNDSSANDFTPHNYARHKVVYTGTHDNDTTVGWWTQGAGDSTRSAADVATERDYAMRYLNTDGTEIEWVMMRTALASVANTVLVPMQDILGLGGEARMNLPGRQAGNWGFRFTWEQVTVGKTHRLAELVDTYDRKRT